MGVYEFQKNCRLCNSPNFKLILDLGKQPPSNALLTKKQVKVKEKKFPLRLYLCKKCFHLQLRDVVDKKLLFSNYFYTTGANQTMVKHFHDYSEYLFKKFLRKTTNPHVIEIGSNDGVFLKNWCQYNTFAVEPCGNFAEETNVEIKNERIQTL